MISWLFLDEPPRADYNFNPTRGVSFMPAIASTSGRLHSEFIRIYSYRLIWKLTAFLDSGVISKKIYKKTASPFSKKKHSRTVEPTTRINEILLDCIT